MSICIFILSIYLSVAILFSLWSPSKFVIFGCEGGNVPGRGIFWNIEYRLSKRHFNDYFSTIKRSSTEPKSLSHSKSSLCVRSGAFPRNKTAFSFYENFLSARCCGVPCRSIPLCLNLNLYELYSLP